jgi:hypothetical protein
MKHGGSCRPAVPGRITQGHLPERLFFLPGIAESVGVVEAAGACGPFNTYDDLADLEARFDEVQKRIIVELQQEAIERGVMVPLPASQLKDKDGIAAHVQRTGKIVQSPRDKAPRHGAPRLRSCGRREFEVCPSAG